MARTANPFTQISKKLEMLKAKTSKLNAEIAAITSLVNAESKKALKAGPAKAPAAKATAKKTTSKKAAGKKAAAKPAAKKTVAKKPAAKKPASVKTAVKKAVKKATTRAKTETVNRVDHFADTILDNCRIHPEEKPNARST